MADDLEDAGASGEPADIFPELLRHLSYLAEELAESQNALAAIRSSWSWRLTAPIRAFQNILRIAGRLVRNAGRGLVQPAKIFGVFEWLRFGRQVQESGLFDGQYYLRTNADVRKLGLSPLFHFFVFGAREGRDPHFLFSVRYYRSGNPELEHSFMNPLVHYLSRGAYQGRDPHTLFDSSFYLEQNPDVREAGFNPLSHYLASGIAEGRNPNSWFCTLDYLERRPEVASYGLNPLIHSVDNNAERRWRLLHRAAGV